MVNKQKLADIIQWGLSTVIVLVVGFVLSMFFFKLDLTEEKRHTLTSATQDMLEEIDDKVFIRVYLHGELDAKWTRLEKAVKERLDEFKDVNDLVEYEFIDIYESGDERTISENTDALYEQGLRFTNDYKNKKGAEGSKIIWPCAMINYKGNSLPVQFYKSENSYAQEKIESSINISINNLEYEMASRIRELLRVRKPSVAFLEGHRELTEVETASWTRSLAESYDVTAVTIDGQVSALTDKAEQQKYRTPKYDLLIVAKPTEAFSLKDKIILDQYIMSGGKVMWLVDPMTTDLDSLKMRQQTMALSNEIGISDMLFDYGVKLNRDLVLDFQSDLIVLDAGRNGEQRNWQPFSWYFAPVILSGSESHPISSNLDPIRFDFVSSMDFVGNNPDVEKTALLKSSELSKIQKAPVRVNTSIVNFDISYFEESKTNNRNLAVLLEGEFESNFRGRLNDSLAKSPEFAFKEKSLKTSMIVISDGDLARNPVVVTRDGSEIPRELGWDNNSRRVIFDNKDFLMNCANYLLNEEALVSLRSRSIELRQLNPQKRENEGQFWTTMNMILPLLVVLVFGIVVVWLKNRYYTRV